MRVFATLGSAPLGADRLSLVEINHPDLLLSFYDHGKGFKTLSTLAIQLREKHYERQEKYKQGSASKDSQPLATQAYIPALTHIQFDGEYATTYNDISAISVRAKVDVEACLPGDLLIRALNSFGAENIAFQQGPKDDSLVISSGRSKLKLPVLPLSAFPYEAPDTKKASEIVLDHSILKGIERCLLSVGNDPTHPAQMGVTLDADDKGNAVLFSTDNFTISRYQTKSKIERQAVQQDFGGS